MSQGPIEIECSQCGAFYRIRAERIPEGGASATCKKCGNRIVVMPPNFPTSTTGSPNAPRHEQSGDERRSPARTTPERKPVAEVYDEDLGTANALKLFVGEKYGEYYGPKFDRFSRGGGKISWNWPAFFFPTFWFLYRKIYGWAILSLLLNIIPFLGWMAGVVWGMSGNYLYYKRAKNKIEEIKKAAGSAGHGRVAERLKNAGGVSRPVMHLAYCLFGIAFIGILAAIAVPQYSAYKARASKAEVQFPSSQNQKKADPAKLKGAGQSAHPKDSEYYARMGYSYFISGEIDSAMLELNKALAADPKDGFAHLLLGFCHLNKENNNTAEKEFHLALTLGERDPRVHFFLGQYHEAQGDYEKAAKAYGAAIKFAPKDPEPYLRLAGLLSAHSEDLAKAKDLAETCLSLNPPDETKVKAYLVLARMAKAKPEREAYIRKALEIDPDNSIAKTLLRFEKMGEEYHANVSITDQARKHFEKAERFFSENRFQEAIVEYKAVIALEPKFAKGYLYLGDCFYRMGQYEEAAVHFTKATEADPSNPQAWAFLGDAYYHMQDLRQALLCLKEAVRLDPEYHNAAQKLRQLEKMANVTVPN